MCDGVRDERRGCEGCGLREKGEGNCRSVERMTCKRGVVSKKGYYTNTCSV